MEENESRKEFEVTILPHLDAAYNLARWLTRNEHDAEDVAQEALLRAFKFYGTFHGGNSRAWLLSIVRNTCYNWLEKNRKMNPAIQLDESKLEVEEAVEPPQPAIDVAFDARILKQALEELPVEFREVIVFRELEELSYKEIADLAKIPIGTVMSRLARGRKMLQESAARQTAEGGAR